MSDNARTLTAAIASGDPEAFAAFYRQWFDFVFGISRTVSKRDEQFCLDVVQDTMMRVIRHMKPLESDEQIKRWLNTVVRSCCYDCRANAAIRIAICWTGCINRCSRFHRTMCSCCGCGFAWVGRWDELALRLV